MTTINTDQQGGAPLALPISQAVRLIWPGLSGKCGPAVRRKRLFAIAKKWTMSIRNWGKVRGELEIMYPDRLMM